MTTVAAYCTAQSVEAQVDVYNSLSDYYKPREMDEIGEDSNVGSIRGSGFAWCENCYSTTVEVSTLSERRCVHATVSTEDVTYVNVRGMLAIDRLVLILASIVVAMAIVGELRDVQLCTIARERKMPADSSGRFWIYSLRVLGFLRHYVFMPMLVGDVSWLVVMKGGDALSMCAVPMLLPCVSTRFAEIILNNSVPVACTIVAA